MLMWQVWHVTMKKSNKKSPFKGDLEGLEGQGDLEGLRQSVFAFLLRFICTIEKKAVPLRWISYTTTTTIWKR